MKDFLLTWKASKQPRKQRKYRYNAPLHIKRSFLTTNLSKPLREKHKVRNISIRTGDQVKVLRGQFRKTTGKVMKVMIKTSKVHIEGVERPKRDGSKSFYPVNVSNVQITELNLEDKQRRAKLEKQKK
tara:strand:+ start:241 stop:624 length:384 start_codon:yes stop_codon:yes gene_type:complete